VRVGIASGRSSYASAARSELVAQAQQRHTYVLHEYPDGNAPLVVNANGQQINDVSVYDKQ
jgi:hypothetical protein